MRSRWFVSAGLDRPHGRFDCSGEDRGEAFAPQALAEAGLFLRLGIADVVELDARLTDSLRDPATGIIGYTRVLEISRTVHSATGIVYPGGSRPLVVGGDCGCIIGALAAARDTHGQLGACFLDAHLDAWDGRSSPTGELADMGIAIITGRGDPTLVDLGAPGPICEPGSTIVIGYRVADDDETQGSEPEHLVADPRTQVIWAESVLRHDAGAFGASTAARLASQAAPPFAAPVTVQDIRSDAEQPGPRVRVGEVVAASQVEGTNECLGSDLIRQIRPHASPSESMHGFEVTLEHRGEGRRFGQRSLDRRTVRIGLEESAVYDYVRITRRDPESSR